MTPIRCLHSWNRRGLTLIEVVAGLALLASLLVGCLTAYGHHVRQVRQARQRLAAVRAADALLAQWFQESGRIPVAAQNSFAGAGQLCWRTRLISDPGAELLASQVVRLEILPPLDQPDRTTILSIDVLAPKALPGEDEQAEKAKGKVDGAP